MSHDEQPNLNPENTNPGWKDRDINMRLVAWVTTVVFAVFIGTMIAMFFVVKTLNEGKTGNNNSDRILAERTLPEGKIILQVDAPQELKIYLDNEQRILTSYAEVSEGYVRTPIDVAKSFMLAKGFAARDVEVPAIFTKPAVMKIMDEGNAQGKPAMEANDASSHDSHEGHAH